MPVPPMTPVDSSNLAQIGYDQEAQELYVEFISGSTYVYSGVPESTAQEIMNADSKGSYFNREIKPNFECRQA
jgi:KTSC domain